MEKYDVTKEVAVQYVMLRDSYYKQQSVPVITSLTYSESSHCNKSQICTILPNGLDPNMTGPRWFSGVVLFLQTVHYVWLNSSCHFIEMQHWIMFFVFTKLDSHPSQWLISWTNTVSKDVITIVNNKLNLQKIYIYIYSSFFEESRMLLHWIDQERGQQWICGSKPQLIKAELTLM